MNRIFRNTILTLSTVYSFHVFNKKFFGGNERKSFFYALNSPADSKVTEEILKSYRPDPNNFERIDHMIFHETKHTDPESPLHGHVLYSSLLGESRVECYEIYKPKKSDTEEIYCIVAFGDRINGWPNIVHGGITALLFDNTFGWLLFAFQKSKAVTASLTVNYRSPILPNSVSILKARIESEEKKKLRMTATIEDAETNRMQADSSALFIFLGDKDRKL